MLKQRLYALLMLVLFGTTLLHSFLPHDHHTHHTDEISVSEHHHHHHQHSDESSEDHEQSGLLAFLLGHHSHSIFNDDLSTEFSRSSQTNIDVQKVFFDLPTIAAFSVFNWVQDKEPLPPDRKQALQKPFLLSCSLRAPPFLG